MEEKSWWNGRRIEWRRKGQDYGGRSPTNRSQWHLEAKPFFSLLSSLSLSMVTSPNSLLTIMSALHVAGRWTHRDSWLWMSICESSHMNLHIPVRLIFFLFFILHKKKNLLFIITTLSPNLFEILHHSFFFFSNYNMKNISLLLKNVAFFFWIEKNLDHGPNRQLYNIWQLPYIYVYND